MKKLLSPKTRGGKLRLAAVLSILSVALTMTPLGGIVRPWLDAISATNAPNP